MKVVVAAVVAKRVVPIPVDMVGNVLLHRQLGLVLHRLLLPLQALARPLLGNQRCGAQAVSLALVLRAHGLAVAVGWQMPKVREQELRLSQLGLGL